MSKLIIWSDLHLGHDNGIRWRTDFDTPEQHHNHMFQQLKRASTHRDVVYLLGDIAITREWLFKVRDEVECQALNIILGNHDTEKKRKQESFVREWLVAPHVNVFSLTQLKKCWLSHAPLHPDELRGRVNIHGHTHGHCIDDPRYINVCPEQTDYMPLDFQKDIKPRIDAILREE